MEIHEGKSKDLRKMEFQNCKAKQCLLRPHPLKFLPHNSPKGDKLSWYWHSTAVRRKRKKQASTETHRTGGKGGISSTIRSFCELRKDLDKLQVIENGSKQELRLANFSLLNYNSFCCALTRRKKQKGICMGSTTCTHTSYSWSWMQKMFRTQRNSGYLICSWTE